MQGIQRSCRIEYKFALAFRPLKRYYCNDGKS